MPASTSMRERTLLVVSGGREAVPIIAEARRMGVRVLVSDGAPDAPGFRLADAGLLASTCDADATVDGARAYAARTPIDGVLAGAADVAVTVAAVADALGLPGVSLATARLAADRLATKACLAAAKIAVPWSAPVESAAALEAFAAPPSRALLAKPVDSHGARGVVRLLRGVDPAWAFGTATAESPTGRVMVEEFVAGPQVAVEAAVVGGRLFTAAVADRNLELLDRFAPFVIDNGDELPSRLSDPMLEKIDALMARAATALGLRHGTIRGTIVIGPEGPMVLELGVRLSGGYAATHEIPLATGIDFVPVAISLALGEEPAPAALRPRWSQGVARRFLFPAPGVVRAVQGAPEAAVGEGVALLELRVVPGERIRPVTSDVCRGGLVIAVGESREDARARAEAAAARVRIVTGPPPRPVGATLH